MKPIKINKSEKDIIATALNEWSIPHTFYTIENNSDMLQLEIETESLEVIWYTAKYIGGKIELDNLKDYIRTM